MRSTSGTTKQTKTSANKNIVRQSQHSSAPAVARSCSVRRQIRSRTAGIRSPRKEAPRPAAPVDDPTNQAEKNSRTNHTNKQTRRKTLRQHSTRRHKSALCYKIQTHASHRAKKQKTGFNPNFTRKLTEGAQKTQKNTVFHVKHSIFYLLIFHKHIGYHIAKSRNCRKKTVNNIGFTEAMHDRKGKRPDKM